MDLDATDRAILYLLQEESGMHLTHDEIGDRINVSSSTVSNRLQELKEREILRGYQPIVDYGAAGILHHLLFICTAPIADRRSICEQTIEIHGVVNVRELLSGSRNLHVEVVAMELSDIETVAEKLDALGLDIDQSEILQKSYYQPFDQFGSDVVDFESE